jgi:hypothetical protein
MSLRLPPPSVFRSAGRLLLLVLLLQLQGEGVAAWASTVEAVRMYLPSSPLLHACAAVAAAAALTTGVTAGPPVAFLHVHAQDVSPLLLLDGLLLLLQVA